MKNLRAFVEKIYDFCITFLFPATDIEKMTTEEFCDRARRCDREGATDLISLFDYQDKLVKKAIWELKFKGNRKVAKLFAEILYDEILEEIADAKLFSDFSHPILIGIPSHPRRLKEKGFNQIDILCKEISLLDENRNFSYQKYILTKNNETQTQTSIKNRTERLANLKDCFTVKDSSKIKNKNIILIDDVTTTGATIREAKRALRVSGAKNIIAFTLTH